MKSFKAKFYSCLFIAAYAITATCPGISGATKDKPPGNKIGVPDKTWVAGTLKNLSLRDKIAQLVLIRAPGKFLNRNSPEFRSIEEQISRHHVGGVILFSGNVYESAILLNELQKKSRLPLLVAADYERGAAFRTADTTSFPWTMAIGATGSENLAYQQGAITAREARALGVHWIFAPVLDVNNNPDNPVINIRSFGENPEMVARMGAAFIRGAKEAGVLTTAKHFPGHGDTSTDTHIGLAVVPSDTARLQTVELVPFKSAIAAGVDAVMTAHVAVPQITSEPEVPATLSSKILTDLLRNTLHFPGLIATDALEMGGITKRYWTGLAAIRAIQAGADVLVLPLDPVIAINEIERAVKRGDISENRINESVERILSAKSRLNLHRTRTVSIDRIGEMVASPQSEKTAQDIADQSITLVRDRQNLLPVNVIDPPRILSLVLSSDLDSSPASVFQAEMRRRFTSLTTAWINERTSNEFIANIEKNASDADLIVCSTLIKLISGQVGNTISANQLALITRLLDSGKPLIWVSFGNPYVIQSDPRIGTYLCTYSYSDVSQIAAAKALSGEIAIKGRIPVSLPCCFNAGDGVQKPRLDMKLKSPDPEQTDSSRKSFDETKQVMASFLESGAFEDATLLVGYHGALVLNHSLGKRKQFQNSAKTAQLAFNLGSLSRVIGVTSAVMFLTETNRLTLSAPVCDYLPEFHGPNKEKVRVQDLLAQTSGLPSSPPRRTVKGPYSRISREAFETPLEYEPGSKAVISDMNVILLEEIISRVAGASPDRFLAGRLFEPIGMSNTFSYPSRLARPEERSGLHSTAQDLAVFSQMLLNRGIYNHRRYFSPETIARFTAQGAFLATQALGWYKPSEFDWTGSVFSPSAFGHDTGTGRMIWIDPEKQLFIVFLANETQSFSGDDKLEHAQKAISEYVLRAIAGKAE